jgi:hypothetical protein
MATLMHANSQWASRPDDQRFTSMQELHAYLMRVRDESRQSVISSRKVRVLPRAEVTGDQRDFSGLLIEGPDSCPALEPTHWAFGQLCARVGAPADYLRTLPAPMVADNLNFGYQVARDVEDVGILSQSNGSNVLRAVTGPKYGRIWSSDLTGAIMQRLDLNSWKVPVEFGFKPGMDRPAITKQSTTLYGSDRDCWIFLADEENRIELPNRRDGKTGSLARGFIAYNSEVGDRKLGFIVFYFDFMCGNHIIWDAENVEEFAMIHRASAPDRFAEEVAPALERYAQQSDRGIVKAIEDARADKLGDPARVTDFLAKRFGPRIAERVTAAHLADEGRPIETRWDALVGATAYARSLPHMDARATFDMDAGKLLQAA